MKHKFYQEQTVSQMRQPPVTRRQKQGRSLVFHLGSLHLYRSLKLGGSSSNFSEITCTVGVGVMGMTKETGCFDIGLLLLLTVATINESKQLAAWTHVTFC